MCLLFNTIGIAASDFLCIDLSTLASVMGLSESLTGVTFLAFGNGSPDVFSTFAAMKSNSGSLAVGELIGAATFITSVVAGSMALVRPFKVARRSFVRDVGYFVIAVSFSMVFLADGRLHVWESAVMVGLYCFYVVMVVGWHWYFVRQRRRYERNVAARSHFHIPENQELDIEELAEDDDPGVGSESRSLLRAGSTEDFDALEQSDLPVWTEDRDEDDETRNRYLAEIRENMHIYRPNSRRRNTALNPIRPSLVGALEFQSVLSSLQRSRNIHQSLGIDLDRYSDDPEARPSRDLDNRSVASHSQVYQSPSHLSPAGKGSARTRAVSANDAAGLKLDTSVFGQNTQPPVQVTVSRPSGEGPDNMAENRPTSRGALSPSDAGDYFSQSPSPGGTDGPRTPDLLAPSDAFRSPNYHAGATRPRSPLHSPRGTHLSPGTSEPAAESPVSPFPPFTDFPETSSRASSIRPRGGSSPTERLQVRDGVSENGDIRPPKRIKWWPYWMLPSPQSLFSTLFPTLCDWKVKSFWERLLGIVAAPTVLFLTVTIPVIEPAPPETITDPIPVVVTSADDGNGSTTPRVRLPDDSPVIRTLEHQSGEEQRQRTDNDGKAQHQPSHGRERFNSEVPAVQITEDAVVSTAREWNQWLVSIQLFIGPFFIALITWTAIDSESRPRYLVLPALVALLFSLLFFTLLRISTRQGHHSQPPKPWRPLLALLGFVVAICWIATIAEEVVNLLKAIGVIMNISDSLLGLTVFAVGNSLGDLVADITVARLGYPVMALSACFGGPMMNILLGIGLGGMYMTVNAKPDAIAAATGLYEISISKVLVISAITLLIILVGVLIVVPLNGWRMDRKIGWGLVVLWCISTLGNVIAEAVS